MERLNTLAKLYGVYSSYKDSFGRHIVIPKNTIIKVLWAMGVKVKNNDDVQREIRKYHRKKRIIEPVAVAWNGKLKFSVNTRAKELRFCLIFENGSIWKQKTANKEIELSVPYGYHKLQVIIGSKRHESFIISAPRKAYEPKKKHRGIFAPLYSLHSKTSMGAGDYLDFEKLCGVAAKNHFNLISTLPLNPILLEPYNDISPYSPASRMFWNEFYISLHKIPELKDCKRALNILNKSKIKSKKVNYKKTWKIKRKVLEVLSHELGKNHSRYREFLEFIRKNPLVKNYAKYRERMEKSGGYWFYLYAQWKAQEQLFEVSQKARENGISLLFDFAVGVHPKGFETHNKKIYLKNISVGAPPDPLFTGGQNWGFLPPHPDLIRQDHYVHFIKAVQMHMQMADFLRIDHIMGLHRVFAIPDGLSPKEGTYISYNHDEFYAILCLESLRNKCGLVGENLGTITKKINKKIREHNIYELKVLQMLINKKIPQIPRRTLLCLNTHDTATFAGFLEGTDIKESLGRGIIGKQKAVFGLIERKKVINTLSRKLKAKGLMKKNTKKELLKASLEYMYNSRAKIAIINPEDLWLEKEPHNRPGTIHGNWQNKMKYSIETLEKRDLNPTYLHEH
ncbi:MAG: 4-alpha-glucanotransferase [Nanoarchaeota archaeon]